MGPLASSLNLATQHRRKYGGPGRTAAPVKRWLTLDEAAAAMRGGKAAQRAAYAWAYGFSCTSNNMTWLRSKIEAAVRGDEEEDD